MKQFPETNRSHIDETVRLRLSKCLVAFWQDGRLVVENYLTKRQSTVAPIIAHLLGELLEHKPLDSLLKIFESVPSVTELLEALVAQDILVIEGTELDRKELLLDSIWKWDLSARYFHFATKDVPFESEIQTQRDLIRRLAKESPPPPPFKNYKNEIYKLPSSFEDQSGDFWDVLRKRRTMRVFSRDAISLQELSTIILWTWGSTHSISNSEIGPYILKTSPSGGSRHTIEVYPLLLRVEDIEPGIYHYSVQYHALECLKKGEFEDLAVQFFANQSWVKDASVVFLMTSVVGRSMWKYRHSHAYRVLLLDAGHLGQTFQLICTKLGLAPFVSAGLSDTLIEQELGLDGVTEIPLYATATGRLAKVASNNL